VSRVAWLTHANDTAIKKHYFFLELCFSFIQCGVGLGIPPWQNSLPGSTMKKPDSYSQAEKIIASRAARRGLPVSPLEKDRIRADLRVRSTHAGEYAAFEDINYEQDEETRLRREILFHCREWVEMDEFLLSLDPKQSEAVAVAFQDPDVDPTRSR